MTFLGFKISNINYENNASSFSYTKTLEEAEEVKRKEERLNEMLQHKARVIIEELNLEICNNCLNLYEDDMVGCMLCDKLTNDAYLESLETTETETKGVENEQRE